MRRHKRKLLGALAVLLLTSATYVLWPQPLSRVTLAGYQRIQRGMSPSDVETVLGPSWDYRTRPSRYTLGACVTKPGGGEGPVVRRTWQGDMGCIVVDFASAVSTAGGVTATWWGDAADLHPGPLETLRWRAERQWRRWFP